MHTPDPMLADAIARLQSTLADLQDPVRQLRPIASATIPAAERAKRKKAARRADASRRRQRKDR